MRRHSGYYYAACLALLQSSAALQGPLSRTTHPAAIPPKLRAEQAPVALHAEPAVAVEAAPASYARGLATIGGITLTFASNSPVLHAATSGAHAPPVLWLNAACAVLALVGLLVFGPLAAPLAPTAAADATRADAAAWRAGGELGLWKFLGATANLYGLSLTSSDHGAFLIQLTTLIVPLVQGARGVPIPPRIWAAVVLALTGVLVFTLDLAAAATSASQQGDALCVLAAIFYATYDLRLFEHGSKVAPLTLVTTKITTQAGLSVAAAAVTWSSVASQLDDFVASDLGIWPVALAAIWSGVFVNAFASVLQVSGQQAVGPARAQVVYASQPLWAAILSLVFLGETVGVEGCVGGALFIAACFLAATAPEPDPNCEVDLCEV